jgi:hypothetical protein
LQWNYVLDLKRQPLSEKTSITHKKEIEEGIPNEDENDTNLEVEDDIEAQFESNDNEEFDPEYNVQDVQDMNMRG